MNANELCLRKVCVDVALCFTVDVVGHLQVLLQVSVRGCDRVRGWRAFQRQYRVLLNWKPASQQVVHYILHK